MKQQMILKMLELKGKYGENLFFEEKRLLAMIKDYFPYAKHEHYLLAISLPLGLYRDLKRLEPMAYIKICHKAIQRLEKEQLVSKQWAREAVDLWIDLIKKEKGDIELIEMPSDAKENKEGKTETLNAGVHAILHKANCYYNGEGIKENRALALEWYEKAALLGSVEAMNYVGNIYYMGDGVPKNEVLALKWYEKAASLGSSVAMNYLGNMYYEGRGVPLSLEKARYWYNQAIAKANYTAMFNMGYIYCEEHLKDGIEDFEVEYEKAQKGDIDAMYHVAYSYHWGDSIQQDYEKANEWYERLANQGEQAAMIWLAYMYLNGQGVARNEDKAKEWCEKAIKL